MYYLLCVRETERVSCNLCVHSFLSIDDLPTSVFMSHTIKLSQEFKQQQQQQNECGTIFETIWLFWWNLCGEKKLLIQILKKTRFFPKFCVFEPNLCDLVNRKIVDINALVNSMWFWESKVKTVYRSMFGWPKFIPRYNHGVSHKNQ